MDWNAIWTDVKQRLLKVEALHGLYWIPAGLFMLWAAYYALQYVITIAAVAGGLYLVIEGIRKLVRNPVKAAVALDNAKDKLVAKQADAPQQGDAGKAA